MTGDASVVFCWELGGGLGHVTKAVLLAERLLDRGCRVSFMLRDLASIDELLPRESYHVLQAPVSWGALAGWPSPADHTELLLHAGFGDGTGLRGRVRGWMDSFDAMRADLVIADHAPTALLAARCAGVPAALFGLGFFAPPPPWPPFRDWEPAPEARRAQARQRVLAQANACLQRHGRTPLADLCELHAVQQAFLLTVPELDHYARPAGATHRGSICIDDIGVAPAWPAATGPRIFAYLRPELSGLQDALAALAAQAAAGAAVLVRCAGLDAATRARWGRPGLVFTDELVRMQAVAREAALVVCSGTDTAHGLALRGVPVLQLPMNAEQRIAATRLEATGAGRMVLPGASVQALAAAMAELIAPPAREAAAALAARHGPQDAGRVMDGVADDCMALLDARAATRR